MVGQTLYERLVPARLQYTILLVPLIQLAPVYDIHPLQITPTIVPI